MSRQRIRRAAATIVITTAAAAAMATTGAATADQTGCPAGYDLVSVASMEAQGPYVRPRLFDEAGNKNGFVCALVRPDAVRDAFCEIGGGNACNLQALGLPAYLFIDDDNPGH